MLLRSTLKWSMDYKVDYKYWEYDISPDTKPAIFSIILLLHLSEKGNTKGYLACFPLEKDTQQDSKDSLQDPRNPASSSW